jgi:hypothetical protein
MNSNDAYIQVNFIKLIFGVINVLETLIAMSFVIEYIVVHIAAAKQKKQVVLM